MHFNVFDIKISSESGVDRALRAWHGDTRQSVQVSEKGLVVFHMSAQYSKLYKDTILSNGRCIKVKCDRKHGKHNRDMFRCDIQ